MPENDFEHYGLFSIVKMSTREVTIFLEKSKLVMFHLKCTKPKQNCIAWISECKTLKIISQFCLIFIFISPFKDGISRGRHTLIILPFTYCDMILNRNDPLPSKRAVVSKLELIEWNYLL